MENFIRHFVCEGRGQWRCVEPATLDLPEGRVQVVPGTVFVRGTRFMNIDVAELLDRHNDIYGRDGQQGRHPG